MKNIYLIICLGVFVSSFASNDIRKTNTIHTKQTLEVVKEVDLTVGLCKGSVVVIGGDGKQKTMEMEAVETDTALDCSKKFLGYVEELELSYTVVSSSSNYNEDGGVK